MSNIEQRARNRGEHDGSITARHRHLPVTESIALPPDYAVRPMSDYMGLSERHRCPQCQTQMVHARTEPASLRLDVRAFECVNCDHIHKDHLTADPMTSSEVVRWFLGELKTPN